MAVPKRVRNGLVAFVTFIGGLYFFAEFVTPKSKLPETLFGLPFDDFHSKISNSIALVGTMAIGLGIINLLRVHGGAIVRGKKGRLNSAALLLGLFTVFAIEIVDFLNSEQKNRELQKIDLFAPYVEHVVTEFEQSGLDPSPGFAALTTALQDLQRQSETADNFLSAADDEKKRSALGDEITATLAEVSALESALLSKSHSKKQVEMLLAKLGKISAIMRTISEKNYNATSPKRASKFVLNAFFEPLGSAMFSLLAFYVASAAYRTFRIRSREAAVMMLTALIVMLGQIPIGYIYISHSLPDIRNWLLSNISTPAFRAIFFGSSVAALAMAVRMWFSLEHSPLAADEGENSNAGGGA